MKVFTFWLLALHAGFSFGASTTTVEFFTKDSQGSALNRRINFLPKSSLQSDGTNIYAGYAITRYPTNGYAVLGLVPSDYWMSVEGLAARWTLSVLSTNATMNGAGLCPGVPVFATNAAAVTVWFNSKDFTGTVLNRKVSITPAVPVLTDGTNLFFGCTLFQTFTNGVFTNKFIPGNYTVAIDGIYGTWNMGVYPSTNLLNAATLSPSLPNYTYTNPPAVTYYETPIAIKPVTVLSLNSLVLSPASSGYSYRWTNAAGALNLHSSYDNYNAISVASEGGVLIPKLMYSSGTGRSNTFLSVNNAGGIRPVRIAPGNAIEVVEDLMTDTVTIGVGGNVPWYTNGTTLYFGDHQIYYDGNSSKVIFENTGYSSGDPYLTDPSYKTAFDGQSVYTGDLYARGSLVAEIDVHANSGRIHLGTNAMIPYGPFLEGGYLVNSNKVLYWITSTKTNLISDGR